MDYTKKKLREAEFFLNQFNLKSSKIIQEESLDFYLSAFLSASRSVTLVLQVEHKQEYDQIFPQWKLRLDENDRELLEFMNDQRVATIHKTGATIERKKHDIPINDFYKDESGQIMVFGPPAIYFSGPAATISKDHYYFQIGGQDELVTELCSRYYFLLTEIVRNVSSATEISTS